MKKEGGRRNIGLSVVLWAMAAVLVLLIVFLVATPKPAEKVNDQEARPIPVRSVVLEPRSFSDTVVLAGRIEPAVAADLAVEKAGKIVEIAVDRGDEVEAGQVLLRVDGRHWEQLRRLAEIESRDAEKDFVRWEELKTTGAVSESDFAAVQKRRDMAATALEQAELDVAKCEVKSPVPGTVDDRYVETGEFAKEGDRVLKIVHIDRVKLVVAVPERDIGAVARGERIVFSVASLQDGVFTGTVGFAAVQADPQTSAYRVEAGLENPGRVLKAGMIADVTLLRGTRTDMVVVPLTSVVPQRGQYVAFVVRDGHAERRVVRIERILEHEAVLSSGLDFGDRLVAEGQRSLRDGSPVTEL